MAPSVRRAYHYPMDRPYYSQRAGRLPAGGAFSLDDLKRLFLSQFEGLQDEGYFQKAFGFECVDSGFTPGTLGTDIQAEFLLSLRKPHLWPIRDTIGTWTEDDVFDVIEFLYDNIAKPTERRYHDYSNCGWHCHKFDLEAGRDEYRQKLNRVLRAYSTGFKLSSSGEILTTIDSGLEPLLEAPIPSSDSENVVARIEAAKRKFRRHRPTLDERRDAIRDLADVLEFLRHKLKGVLTSNDESDLFNIVNNFGIRHHNQLQKVVYDKAIWYSWLFYYFLASIHAAIRLIDKEKGGGAA